VAEVGGVNQGGGPVTPAQAQGDATAAAVTPAGQPGVQPEGLATPVGQPGQLGQPTGLPAPATTAPLMPDALAGRDPSQLVAAEQMRARGGASATEELLGLNRQPTMAGALAAPPGNAEALRHMTPTMRRTLMRNLLDKQRAHMRRLAHLMRRERDGQQQQGGDDGEESTDGESRQSVPVAEFASAAATPDEAQLANARAELGSAARMLDLLDELLAMQDYAISQMGTFSQG
jgi:hypothetical protein